MASGPQHLGLPTLRLSSCGQHTDDAPGFPAYQLAFFQRTTHQAFQLTSWLFQAFQQLDSRTGQSRRLCQSSNTSKQHGFQDAFLHNPCGARRSVRPVFGKCANSRPLEITLFLPCRPHNSRTVLYRKGRSYQRSPRPRTRISPSFPLTAW